VNVVPKSMPMTRRVEWFKPLVRILWPFTATAGGGLGCLRGDGTDCTVFAALYAGVGGSF
jgi:hypothetical protein